MENVEGNVALGIVRGTENGRMLKVMLPLE